MLSLLQRFHTCSKTFFCFLVVLLLLGFQVSPVNTPGYIRDSLAQNGLTRPTPPGNSLPLNFELNQGQTHRRVKFIARSEGYVLFLTATEAVMALDNPAAHRKGKENLDVRDFKGDLKSTEEKNRPPRSIVRMKLEGSNPAPQIEGLDVDEFIR